MGNISRVKINQGSEHYLKDEFAIKKIIFNEKEYTTSIEKNGVVEIVDPFVEELKLNNILIKNIVNYGDEIQSLNNNGFYIVKERESGELAYSIFVIDKEGKRIRLTTPGLLFETKDLNFSDILNNDFPRFITFDNFLEYFNLNKKPLEINGTDLIGNNYENQIVDSYLFKVVEQSDDHYEQTQYIVFKSIKDSKNYYIKQYVKIGIDGIHYLLNDGAFICIDTDNEMKKNDFARQIEKVGV